MSKPAVLCSLCLVLAPAVAPMSARAQTLISVDDEYGVPFGQALTVEAHGVLDNDTIDGEPAGENGATAELVTGVSHGTLSLNPDGSFTYAPGGSFDGLDGFVYRAVLGALSQEGTVKLSACGGGPEVFECWNESAFLAKAVELGYSGFTEGFENDAVWGAVRSPDSAPAVVSQGIRWTSNHPDPPASNDLTTGSGPARTGLWGAFDPDHGYATGTPTECDIDNPPTHCLHHDGVSGTREPGAPVLRGVGGYFTGTYGANVGILLDGAAPVGGGVLTLGHQFFGIIDTGPGGFDRFEFRELDGKVGQALFIFADDFTLLTPQQTAVDDVRTGEPRARFTEPSPNPSDGRTTFRFSLPAGTSGRLRLYDLQGRLVRTLGGPVEGEGEHVLRWDGRDSSGRAVAAGVYFGRLSLTRKERQSTLMRRIVVMR